jgi:predicted RND superfamily exporter protein
MTTRDRIDLGFVRWGHFVFRHARAVIAAVALLTAGLASQLPELVIDGSDEAFLHETDPVRVTYDDYRVQFGREAVIAVAIRAPAIFDLGFLEKLRAFHRDLERELPQVEEVTSLINARYTHGLEDELVVEDLLEEWPGSAADLAQLEARVLANPLYRNWLISESARVTTVLIELDTYSSSGTAFDALSGFEESEPLGDSLDRPFLTGEEIFSIVDALQEVVARHDAPEFQLAVAGGPVVDVAVLKAMQRDMAIFVGLSVLMIAFFLFVIFRRLSGVALPLMVVALSLLCTIGTMATAGVPVTLPVQILPSFLLAVGVCASIHLLAIFFRALESGDSREQAIAHALGHSGVAIVLTSLTTAGGLVAFASADLAPVMHFGIFGPVGVFFALAFTLVLLPALLALTPLRQLRRRPPEAAPSDRLLLGFGAVATRRPRVVLFVAALLVIAGVTGAWRLRFSWDPIKWFPETEPVRVATELVDRELGGSSTIAVMLDTGVENGLHDPALLARLDELRVYAESLERGPISVGKTVSVADVLKEIHQALNENRPEYYTIPGDRRLVAQEFLLFENAGSDDLEDVVDSRFAVANFTLRVPWGDAFESAPFVDEIEAHFSEVLGDEVRVTMTGKNVIGGRIFTRSPS